MDSSPQAVCNTLARSRILPLEEILALHRRWRSEAGAASDDVQKFLQWLGANRAITAYQAGMLQRGSGDRLLLDDYTLIDRIGQGRMAGVYKARHRLGGTVAIKILPPSKVKDAQAFGRFQREARLALKLKHPNVVRTFQMGEDKGLHYLVMEHLEGETLLEVLQRRGKLPPGEAVRLIHQALLGLEHLHKQDMVHRDLAPANLMLVPGPIEGRPDNTLKATVKILDIGVGRALFDEADTDGGGQQIDLTTQGDILGNPDYMSPEQARDAHSADIRSDIYALGCVLYHTLTGQPPFPDSNTVRKLVRHATEAPKPGKTFAPGTPDGLQTILDWLMHKDPARRYPTPERAAQALEVFLEAGAEPAHDLEAQPQMQPYLQWLNAAKDVPVALPVAPAKAWAGNDSPVRPATPVDVELVPVPVPQPVELGRHLFDFSRRDWMLFGLGGTGVLFAILSGMWFAGAFKKK
jgi:serine/threonine protein kinase